MALAPMPNQSNLLQRSAGRPTLEQMRSKLATYKPEAVQAPKAKPQYAPSYTPMTTYSTSEGTPFAARQKKAESKVWIWVFAISGLLVASNFVIFIQKEKLIDSLGLQREITPLKAPAELMADDQALFWAYAAFAPEELLNRYKISQDQAVDEDDAKNHLRIIFQKGLGKRLHTQIENLAKAHGKTLPK